MRRPHRLGCLSTNQPPQRLRPGQPVAGRLGDQPARAGRPHARGRRATVRPPRGRTMAEIVTPAAMIPGAVSSALDCCPTCGTQLAGAAADRDQDASDRDDTAESRDRAAERRDRGADDRDATARRELRTVSDGERLAGDRAVAGRPRPVGECPRPAEPSDRDQHSADCQLAAGGDPLIHDRVFSPANSRVTAALRRSRRSDRGRLAVRRRRAPSCEEIPRPAKYDWADAASG